MRNIIMVFMSALVSTIWVRAAEVSKDATSAETQTQRDARLQWFRDAKFGALISFNPSSITGGEIGWSRGGTKPLDLTGDPAGVVGDPKYDNLYKQFNPEKFDAGALVALLRQAGMSYLVYNAKHHDGFAMFHTKFRPEYSIAAAPFKRDVVKELSDACHKAGLRFGIYYSQRDWTHPDYGMGDNRKYIDFMNGQLRELLTNYGKVDIIWFDSYGKGDLEKFWQIGETWSLLKSLQPAAVVNNRLAVLASYNQQPAPYRGDFDTPEQSVGKFQSGRAWESCMTLTEGWSHRSGGKPRSFQELLTILIQCVTGDGNLMLGFGPDASGLLPVSEAERLKEIGTWLHKYGESVYGTRGGPYRNGKWGGSCQKGDKVYLHVAEWPAEGLVFDPLSNKVISARTLIGVPVSFRQSADELAVEVAEKDREKPVTVIELTLDKPVETGLLIGGVRAPKRIDK